MIVVFGSINLDLAARVTVMPRPGETLHGEAFAMSPGGKGANQALAARRAGAAVALVGAVGRDAFAAPALAHLRAAGVNLDGVASVHQPTGVAMIHVDSTGENAITIVAGANAQASAAAVTDAMLAAASSVVMQLEIPVAAVAAVARRARAAGVRVIVNAAPALRLDAALLADIDVLVVNEHEAATLAVALDLSGDPARFVDGMAGRFGGTVIVTRGARGLVAASGAVRVALAAPRVDAVDTVGAGDAFVGALAAALDRQAPLLDALKEGLAAGSLACTRPGAQAALPDRAAIVALAATI